MPTILVVDADPGIRQIIEKILVPYGYLPVHAEDGAQALERCRKSLPDLVLLDIGLPDMEPGEVLRALKEIKTELPVVVLSGIGDVEAAQALKEIGAFGSLLKPFKVEDLLRTIKRALAKAPPEMHEVPKAEEAAADLPPPPPVPPARDRKLPLPRISRRPIIIGGLIAVLLAGAFFLLLDRGEKAVEFFIPYLGPTAMYLQGNDLLIADFETGAVYRHGAGKKWAFTEKYFLGGLQPSGMTFDGKYLWVSLSLEGKIYRCTLEPKFSIVADYDSPGPSPAGLAADGTVLWSLDFQQNKAYEHQTDKALAVVRSYDSPVPSPQSLHACGESFFMADSRNGRLVRVSRRFTVEAAYLLPAPYRDAHIAAVAGNERHVWICFDTLKKVVRFRIAGLTPATR